jgi:hypothetical protein
MRTLGLACLLVLSLQIGGCGNVMVRGFWNGGTQTVSGVVSIVQLTAVFNGDVSTQVTVVTLTSNFGNSTESFCGDQRTQFPLNDFVQANFTPGRPCSDLFSVVIKVS